MMEIELQSFFHLIHNLNILTLRHPRLSQCNLKENILLGVQRKIFCHLNRIQRDLLEAASIRESLQF